MQVKMSDTPRHLAKFSLGYLNSNLTLGLTGVTKLDSTHLYTFDRIKSEASRCNKSVDFRL